MDPKVAVIWNVRPTPAREMARAARYTPWLIGYTDITLDPRRYHPNDPRTEPDETDGLIDSIRIAIARCEETLGRVELALNRRDTDAAQDLVRSAINELEEVATVESEV